MWFGYTFAFTMLEPREKILSGEPSVEETKKFGRFLSGSIRIASLYSCSLAAHTVH